MRACFSLAVRVLFFLVLETAFVLVIRGYNYKNMDNIEIKKIQYFMEKFPHQSFMEKLNFLEATNQVAT
ncbi:hypothetical protein Sjap_008169 [Stephania japonica]|uniref:Uncharacterized protein n=1 Tax=Stephania japonica TaxID=461633 RepID=A0AAP0PEC0_9MAGN